jgi:hypothetical protein
MPRQRGYSEDEPEKIKKGTPITTPKIEKIEPQRNPKKGAPPR